MSSEGTCYKSTNLPASLQLLGRAKAWQISGKVEFLGIHITLIFLITDHPLTIIYDFLYSTT